MIVSLLASITSRRLSRPSLSGLNSQIGGRHLAGGRSRRRDDSGLPVEITLSDLRWLKMDMDKVVTRGDLLDHVDLSKVDEVGFTDLMPGSCHGDGGYSGVGRIEVYGKPVKRDGEFDTPDWPTSIIRSGPPIY